MKVYSKTLTTDRALYQRLERAFAKYPKLYFSFSGGKESLVIATAIRELVRGGKIDGKKLIVIFIDEEAIYPCVEKVVHAWRGRFRAMGARFEWLCVPFKHFNCFNSLQNDESFILFEPGKESVWCRQPPAFALRTHPLFIKGDKYQDWGERLDDAPTIIGIRAEESVQRSTALAYAKKNTHNIYPVYDWSLNDVWLFLRDHKVVIPDAYVNMYKVGVPPNRLRISQFFSIDTAQSLVRMVEFYPGLYERIIAREENAYLAMYYWDSEMFRRMSRSRKELERTGEWRQRFYAKLKTADSKGQYRYRVAALLILRHGKIIESMPEGKKNAIYRSLYDIITTGDPKKRLQRSIYSAVGQFYYANGGRGGKRSGLGLGKAVDHVTVGGSFPAQAERLQPEQGSSGEPRSASAVDSRERLDTADRGTA